jgi:MFS family permease
VADIAPPKRRAEAIGFFSAANAIGLIIGPVVGFMFVEATGFRHLFYFAGGLAFSAFLISLFTRERRQSGGSKRQSWTLRTGIVAVEALPAAWIVLCMGMGFGVVHAFIAIFSQLRDVANPGFYFMVQAIAVLISRTFSGRLADRHGRVIVIVPGILLMAISLAVLPLAYGYPYFVISASLFGLGFGSAMPASTALLIDRVRPERRGLAMSTYLMGLDVGFSIGSILLGWVSQQFGFGVMWPLAATCTLLGLAGLLADRRRVTSATIHLP